MGVAIHDKAKDTIISFSSSEVGNFETRGTHFFV